MKGLKRLSNIALERVVPEESLRVEVERILEEFIVMVQGPLVNSDDSLERTLVNK
jgi:hypothetical protein